MLRTGVYAIRHIASRKVYVGSASSRSIYRRWAQHRLDLRCGVHHSRYLQRAWDKYGAGAFEWLVLERCSPDRCLAREQVWMDFYRSFDPASGYNVSPTAASCSGVKHTAETRAKVSAAGRGRQQSPEQIERSANKRRGLKRSDETKARISEAARRRWAAADKAAWSEKMRSRALSDEARAVLSANGRARAGKPRSEETKARISASLRSSEAFKHYVARRG